MMSDAMALSMGEVFVIAFVVAVLLLPRFAAALGRFLQAHAKALTQAKIEYRQVFSEALTAGNPMVWSSATEITYQTGIKECQGTMTPGRGR